MGLIKKIELGNGIVMDNAYVRIDNVSGYKSNLDISVNAYASQDFFNSGKSFIEQKNYSFTPSVEDSAKNFIKQGYEYLKTLSEYADSIDC